LRGCPGAVPRSAPHAVTPPVMTRPADAANVETNARREIS